MTTTKKKVLIKEGLEAGLWGLECLMPGCDEEQDGKLIRRQIKTVKKALKELKL